MLEIAAAAAGLVAAGGGASAIKAYLDGRRIETASHPPRGRFVEIDGLPLHVCEAGPRDAPPVVLLHGIGGCVEDFIEGGLVDHLARDYRVFMMDRPGYGHSPRPAGRFGVREQVRVLRRLLARETIRAPLVVGHSYGALVALALVLHPKSEVAGAVLMSGMYYPDERLATSLLALPTAPLLGPALLWTLGAPLARQAGPHLRARSFEPQTIPPALAARYPTAYAERPWQLRAQFEEAASLVADTAALAPLYRTCKVPLAILHGDSDRSIEPDQAGRLAAAIPHARLRLLEGLGHMTHVFAHEAVREALAPAARERALPSQVR